MNQIAILSDIHSNLPALEAVLRDVKNCGADRVIFLGDTVGYGASPFECVEWVMKLGGESLMGNHDAAIKRIRLRGRQGMVGGWDQSGYYAGLLHSAEKMDEAQASWLEGLPFTLIIPGAIVAHANLHDPQGFDYISSRASASATLKKLATESHKIGFFGHTHVQELFCDPNAKLDQLDETRFHIPAEAPCVVMVGSVGQPRHETDLRASWVLWQPEERLIEMRKTEYNRQQAAQDIVEAGLPLESAFMLLTDEEAALLVK
jgi:predicted phosphodiesterase